MPQATPFMALGAGNGFPMPLTKRDVSDFDYWTTLSGFNKNNSGKPTKSEIAKSINSAINLFWNAYQANFNIFAEHAPPDVPISSVEATSAFATDIFGNSVFPKNRSCKSIMLFSGDGDSDGLARYGYSGRLLPQRMYKGDTSDEDNFVGLGIDRFLNFAARAPSVVAALEVGSFLNDSNFPRNSVSIQYAELNGISFVSKAGASGLTGSTLSTSQFSASASSGPDLGFYGTATVSLSGLEFYTYPTT
jgi:hypothetical protein